jgi:hypothetical protein
VKSVTKAEEKYAELKTKVENEIARCHDESLSKLKCMASKIRYHIGLVDEFWRENELRTKMLEILRDNIFVTPSVEEWKRLEMNRLLLVW